MRDRNLYRDIVLMDRIAQADNSTFTHGSTSIVIDPTIIERLTAGRPDPFRDQSAFFRTHASNPLPAELRRTLRRNLVRLTVSEEAQYLIGSPQFSEGEFRMQGWGVVAVFDMLLPIICGHRSPELIALTRRYVEEVVISSNIKGIRKARQPLVSSSIWKAMEPHLQYESSQTIRDLVDVAISIRGEISLRELPEVFARLVLSMVGFTGTALEWSLIFGLTRGSDGRPNLETFHPHDIVAESQRLAPTAWKLIRETKPTDGEEVHKVVLMTSAVHRSAALWAEPLRFDPSRWSDGFSAPSVAYFPFGKHNMVCPARQFALDLLEHSLSEIHAGYSVRIGRTLRRPRAHILFVPPPMKIKIKAKTREDAK